MKKTVVILLMLIYGSATMGTTIHKHYCMNVLVGWSLWHSEKEECGKCGMKEDKTGCCKDEHQHFKLKADQHKAAGADLVKFNIAPAIATPIPDVSFQVCATVIENYSPSHSPPGVDNTRLHIFHCVFLI